MAKSLQLKYAVWVYLLLNWSVVAYAAENPLVEGIESIPVKAMLYVFALSTVGGAAGTLTRMASPSRPTVTNLPLEISKDVMSSLLAGILAFFFTSWAKDTISFWPQAALITLAGYGGSKTLDIALTEGLMPWLKSLMERLFGANKSGG